MTVLSAKVKEAKILRSEGTSIAEIARRLYISEQTARNWTQGVEIRNGDTIAGEGVVDRLQMLIQGTSPLKTTLYEIALHIVQTANEIEAEISPIGYSRLKAVAPKLSEYVKNNTPSAAQVQLQKAARNSLLVMARVQANAGKLDEAESWYQRANEQWEVTAEQKREFMKLLQKKPLNAKDILKQMGLEQESEEISVGAE